LTATSITLVYSLKDSSLARLPWQYPKTEKFVQLHKGGEK
jgi:hypothetical protein